VKIDHAGPSQKPQIALSHRINGEDDQCQKGFNPSMGVLSHVKKNRAGIFIQLILLFRGIILLNRAQTLIAMRSSTMAHL
jgi:hypothetical protein